MLAKSDAQIKASRNVNGQGEDLLPTGQRSARIRTQMIRYMKFQYMPDKTRITRIAFMSGTATEMRLTNVPKIHETFDDTVEIWIGYPLTRRAVADRPTLYLQERCRLVGLWQEMYDLIFASDEQCRSRIRDFAAAVDQMSTRLRKWYRFLPFELRYEWPFNIAVWELQYVSILSDLSLVC